MAVKSYAEKLRDPRWQKKRLEIFNRDNWRCCLCGDKQTTLNVHHLDYENKINPWDVENDSLVTYCEDCHFLVEKIFDITDRFKKIDKIHKVNFDTHKIMCIKGFDEGTVYGFFIINDSTIEPITSFSRTSLINSIEILGE